MSSGISRTHLVDYGPTNLPAIDFALVLARAIDSVQTDPTQLRNTVYELARAKLLEVACEHNPPTAILELPPLMLALETAITRVEMHAVRQEELRVLRSIAELIDSDRDAHDSKRNQRDPVVILEQAAVASDAVILANSSESSRRGLMHKRKSNGSHLTTVLRGGLAIAAIAACLITTRYVTLSQSNALSEHNASTRTVGTSTIQKSTLAAARIQSPVARPQSPALPLPSVYGIYAISDDQLYELEALPGRVPDQRVFISTPVTKPSRTMLPNGRIAFIVFRRDMTQGAPERVAVRVIAKVMRGMTFDPAGKASTGDLDDQWAIRSTSYDLRVAPLNDNPEMILIRPESSEFVLPAGRYGLVLKGQAFDFSVAGPITEPAQCLERIAAANGTFYSECRSR
jgi:hypothetical protein